MLFSFVMQGSVSNGIDSKSLDAALSEKEMSNFKKNCAHCHCQNTSQLTSPNGPKVTILRHLSCLSSMDSHICSP